MVFKRNLKYGMRGSDVRYCKDSLFVLGFYADTILSITNDRFGSGTLAAVLKFQRAHRDADGKQLKADGVTVTDFDRDSFVTAAESFYSDPDIKAMWSDGLVDTIRAIID